ncbi:MAG: hypothetical protein IH625_15025 [Rhodobacteraceae bacterium]|nr:hypothetical protein [Paracoccaceae bacterium]
MTLDWTYLFSLAGNRDFWAASLLVAWLSILSWVFGRVLSFGMALARSSGPGWARGAAATYIWFFRSLPLLVMLTCHGIKAAFGSAPDKRLCPPSGRKVPREARAAPGRGGEGRKPAV